MKNPSDLLPNFHPQAAFPSPYDPRDHRWEEVGFATPPFDWNKGYHVEAEIGSLIGAPTFKFPIKDQDGSGSCGGQAWSYYAGAIEAIATGSFEERSAKYIYAQTFAPGGGSGGRDNSQIFVNQGVAREAVLTSYDHGAPPSEMFMERKSDITATAIADAKKDRAITYIQIGSGAAVGIDTLAQAIQANHGIVIGVDGSNNGTWLSPYPKAPKDGEAIWRHWLFACGAMMINGVKYIEVVNSWGAEAGTAGHQWLSEAYVTSLVHDAAANLTQPCVWESWACVYNPEPAPALKHTFSTDIKYGQSGAEVVALQQALQIDGEFPAGTPATGYYGDITRTAVLAFQVRYSVASNAELQSLAGKTVGPATRAQLNKMFS